jgi:hypothetical protein
LTQAPSKYALVTKKWKAKRNSPTNTQGRIQNRLRTISRHSRLPKMESIQATSSIRATPSPCRTEGLYILVDLFAHTIFIQDPCTHSTQRPSRSRKTSKIHCRNRHTYDHIHMERLLHTTDKHT